MLGGWGEEGVGEGGLSSLDFLWRSARLVGGLVFISFLLDISQAWGEGLLFISSLVDSSQACRMACFH